MAVGGHLRPGQHRCARAFDLGAKSRRPEMVAGSRHVSIEHRLRRRSYPCRDLLVDAFAGGDSSPAPHASNFEASLIAQTVAPDFPERQQA
jgi:hypothetical protein